MPPSDPASVPLLDPAAPAAPGELATLMAQRREKRLVPVEPGLRTRPAAAVRVPQKTAAVRPERASAIESKVTASQDPDEMLRLLQTEAALRRAQRLSGQGDSQRQAIRLLSICMLFALLTAAIGAMWYLQTSAQGTHRVRRPMSVPNTAAPTVPDRPAPRAL